MSKLNPSATMSVFIGETGWASEGSSVMISASDAPVPPCTDRLIATACNEGVYVKGFIDWVKMQTPPLVSFLFEMYNELDKPGKPDEPFYGLFTEHGNIKLFPGVFTGAGVPLHAKTKASTLLRFRGSANRVGKVGDRGQVQIAGKFTFNGDLDLANAVVFLERLLVEDDVIIDDEIVSGGELVTDPDGGDALPLFLLPRQGGKEYAARYETSGWMGPRARMEINTRNPGSGVYEFNARVKRLSIPQSAGACEAGDATVALTTSFTIDDGIESVLVSTQTDWRCRGSRRRARNR
jgi:hypothetical protein